MDIDRFITPDLLAAVALADVDDSDSLLYVDRNEAVVTARTKTITIADLRSSVLRVPVLVGDDPDPMDDAILRVGGDSLFAGSCVINDDLDVAGACTVGGSVNIVGAITVGSTTTFNAIEYTWPAADVADRFLKSDGAGGLTWATAVINTSIDDLSDVTVTIPAAGQVLRWSGTEWVNSTDGSSLTLSATNLTAGTVPNGRLTGAYTGVTGLGIQAQGLQFDDALYDIGGGGKRPRDFTLSRNAVVGGSVTAATFSGDGSALSALSATNLTTGTIAVARVAGYYTGIIGVGILTHDLLVDNGNVDVGSGGNAPRDIFTTRDVSVGRNLSVTGSATAASFSGNGSALTALNGTQVTTGTVAAARLATHNLITAHTATGLTAGQVVRASGAATFAWATLDFADLANVPTTIAGYGITNAYTKTEVNALVAGVDWNSLANTPTTIAGYGITDAVTVTGAQSIAGAVTVQELIVSKAAGNARIVRLATSGTVRWDLAADSGSETGSNAGSAFLLTAYDDAGTAIDSPITITRAATGKISFARHISAGTDATYDLGSGNRFRDLTLSRNATIGGDATVAGTLTVASIVTNTVVATTLSVSTLTVGSLSTGPLTTTTLHASAAATFDTTIAVTGASSFSTVHATGAGTFDSTVDVTGNFAVNTSRFTVAASSGNTVVAGTLSAAGTTVSTLHSTGAVTFDAQLTIANGGTGVASFTAGDLPYYASGTALSVVAIGTASKILRSTGTAPAWSTATFPNAATSGDLMVATGSNAWGSLAIGANQRVLQSDGSAAVWSANLNVGSGTIAGGATTVTTLHATGAATLDSTVTAAGVTSSANLTANGAAATHRGFRVTTAGSLRWFARADDGAEAGSNAGSDFRITAYTDSAVAIDDPIVVARASGGTIYLQRPTQFSGNVEFGTDAAYDIGAVNRPRDFRLSRNALIGGTLGVTGAVSLTVALTVANGGTGLASYTAGDLPYYASGTAFSKVAIGANKTVMQSNGSAPTWTANLDLGTGTITSGKVTIDDSYLEILPNSAHTYTSFALTGRDLATGVSVPYFVPTGTNTDQRIALDLVVKGSPTDTALRGVAWIDVTDTNVAGLAAGNYEALSVGKFVSGVGHISMSAGGTGSVRDLALQLGGGKVTVGATQLPTGATTALGTFPHSYLVVNPDTNTNAARATGLVTMSYGQRNSWWAINTGGTVTAPTAVANAANMFQLGVIGYDGTAYGVGALWSVVATEAWAVGSHGSRVDILTVPNGSASGGIAATFGQDKSLTIGGAFSGATTGAFSSSVTIGTHTASTNATLILDGASTSGFGPYLDLRRNNTAIAYIGSNSAINSGTSDNLEIFSTATVQITPGATAANRVLFSSLGITASTDAALDIGQSGANRFRDLFLSRNAVIGGTLSLGSTLTVTTGGLTVSAGTTSVQGLAATTATFTGATVSMTAASALMTIGGGGSGATSASIAINGSSGATQGAYIQFQRNGSTFGYLANADFLLGAGGSALVLSAQGQDLILRNNSAVAVTFSGSTAVFGSYALSGITTLAAATSVASPIIGTTTNVDASFVRNSVEYLRFSTSAFAVTAAATFANAITVTSASTITTAGSTTVPVLDFVDTDSGVATDVMARFTRNGSTAGTITTTLALVTAYNTTSDERLKRDLGAIPDLILPNLRIRYYERPLDGSREIGVFAQEAYEFTKDKLPAFITPGTNKLDGKSGLPTVPWQADWSKMVPELVLGWQHHERRIDDLFADVVTIDHEFSDHELRILALESENDDLRTRLAAAESTLVDLAVGH